jgi:ubiquinone biosynthesis protein
MLPLARQARYLGRYRRIAQVLGHHGFGYVLEQLGLINLLSLPRRIFLRVPPPPPVGVAERLRYVLIDLGPTFIKLGQLLSTRPDLLPADLIREMNKLQDTVPPFPSEVAVATIEQELGLPVEKIFRQFAMTPLAAASLGQVHAAVLHSGKNVVVKVQRPDIVTVINTDLEIINELAALAQQRAIFPPKYDLVGLAREFSVTMLEELNYTQEASNAERFRRNFAGNPRVYIPIVYHDYSSSRVLTTERLYGIKINDVAALDAAKVNRKRLARHSLQLIIEEVFQHGFFHGDPHPGNFFALRGEVVGAIDFGQVGILDRDTTRNLLLLLIGLTNYDSEGVIRALLRLGVISRQNLTSALRHDINRFISRYVDRPLQEISFREMGNELFSLAERHDSYISGPLALLLKTLIMAEGIGLQIDPDLDVFEVARPYTQRALAEQFSPRVLAEQVSGEISDFARTSLDLPEQLGNVLQRLDEGKLVLHTRDEEMKRLSGAIIGAANRLAVALVLAALLLLMGMGAIAVAIGNWEGTWLTVLAVVAGASVLIIGLVLFFALVRGRNV